MGLINSTRPKTPNALLTAARIYLPCVFHEKVRIDLMNVKATFLSHRRGTIDAKDRNFRQTGIVKAVWGFEGEINLSYMDFQCRRGIVH
jgi:hypothetical protein